MQKIETGKQIHQSTPKATDRATLKVPVSLQTGYNWTGHSSYRRTGIVDQAEGHQALEHKYHGSIVPYTGSWKPRKQNILVSY